MSDMYVQTEATTARGCPATHAIKAPEMKQKAHEALSGLHLPPGP